MKIIFPVVVIMLVLLVLCSCIFGAFGYYMGIDKGKALAIPIVETKVVHDTKFIHDSPTIVQQSSGNYDQGVIDGKNQIRDTIWTYFQAQCSKDASGQYSTTLSRDGDGTLHFHCP